MLTFHLLTIFPEFFRTPFEYGVVSRACSTGLVAVETHDLRDYAFDRHRTVDDRPFGGNEGMVMKVEPNLSRSREGRRHQTGSETASGRHVRARQAFRSGDRAAAG